MPSDEQLREIAHLILGQRWCAMATREEDCALASMVAYAFDRSRGDLLLHLSRLAPHTRNLLEHGAASLVISQADSRDVADPQTLARVTITGEVEPIARDSAEYPSAKAAYLQRLPSAEQLFEFADFVLFRLRPREARFVGGFAQAHKLSGEALMNAVFAGDNDTAPSAS